MAEPGDELVAACDGDSRVSCAADREQGRGRPVGVVAVGEGELEAGDLDSRVDSGVVAAGVEGDADGGDGTEGVAGDADVFGVEVPVGRVVGSVGACEQLVDDEADVAGLVRDVVDVGAAPAREGVGGGGDDVPGSRPVPQAA